MTIETKELKEFGEYAKSYRSLEKESENIQKEVKYLRIKNEKLEKENDNLISYINAILKAIKDFFRHLLIKQNFVSFFTHLYQKQGDATLGYERVYDTSTGDIYKAENGFMDNDWNGRYEKVTDDMYNLLTSGYIEKK